MTIEEIYQWCNFISNKKESGAISPSEFNLAIKVINLDILKTKIGLPEEYQFDRPSARQMWQVSQKITDDLKKFVVKTQISKSGDYFALPSDYVAFSSLRFKYVSTKDCLSTSINVPIEVMSDSEFSDREQSQLLPPTMKRPICNYYTSGLRVLPESVSEIELTYLRRPATPIRNYTIDSNDEAIYNSTGSVDFEYPDVMHNDICIRICEYFGINIREEALINFANQRKERGQ